MRQRWYDWQWWWHNRVSIKAKGTLATVIALLVGIGGYLGASRLISEPGPVALVNERLVTVVRKTPGGMTTTVVTETDRVTRPGETITNTDLVTVTRDGKTVVIRRPEETITDTVRGPTKVVTKTRTNTLTDTETETGPRETVTQTSTGTVTETREVPGRGSTVTETDTVTETETETEQRTVTDTETVTQTVTETETQTVTETGPPDKP